MTRILLALCLLAACDGTGAPEEREPAEAAEGRATPEEPTETEAPTAAEAPAEAEAATPTEAQAEPEETQDFYVAERPDPFFMVDDCHGALGATAAEALGECRRLARGGRPYLRRMCDCRPAMVLEITSSDPIAFYRACCWAPGDTPAEAYAECERRVRDDWCRPEDPRRVDAVTGPYERPGTGGLYEDAEVHRYLAPWPSGEHFDWVDESGEPPCFAAGTPIATPEGEVPIEDIAPGDRVVTLRAGRSVVVPVVATKSREVKRLVVLEVGGVTLRLTPEHPLRRSGAWVEARELSVGDLVETKDGFAPVRAMSLERGRRTVHALRVGAPHTYLAAGVLTHNY